MKSTNKDMADSLFFWGTAKIYKYGAAVRAVAWNGINNKIKNNIERRKPILGIKNQEQLWQSRTVCKDRII